MIAQETIRDVSNAMDIVDIISSFLTLKRRGVNHIGQCPFHNEKTSSFTVSPAKQIYKCFGCGKSGNAITFLMEHESMTYPQAMRYLAERYNIPFEETFASDQEREAATNREAIKIVNKAAADYFEMQTAAYFSYMVQRGITPQTAAEFRLGYNHMDNTHLYVKHGSDIPQDCTLYQWLLSKNYSKEAMIRAGLVTEIAGILYDVFRDRYIFPIQDLNGSVMGFAGRIWRDGDTRPKYINTAENELYLKRELLYGLFQSRKYISELDEVIMTEGYTDVIALFQGHIKNVVATCGTSITMEQIKKLKRFTSNVVLLYDGDGAGLKAVLRSLPLFLQHGMLVSIVLLPSGDDPDSFVRSMGKDAVREYIAANRLDIVSFYTSRSDMADPETKDRIFKELIELVNHIPAENRFRKQALFDRMAEAFNVPTDTFAPFLNKNEPAAATAPALPQPEPVTLQDLEIEITRCLLLYYDKPYKGGWVFSAILEMLPGTPMEDYQIGEVTSFIHQVFAQTLQDGALPDVQQFLQAENQKVAAFCASILMDDMAMAERWDNTHGLSDMDYTEKVTKAMGMFKIHYLRLLLQLNRSNSETDPEGWTKGKALIVDMAIKKAIREVAKELHLANFKL